MLPLKQELLSELIKQNKSNRVTAAREIHYLITNILGKDIANACLLIALAECEKIQSAENFLEKTIIPSERLVNQIQSLPDEKRLKVSLELFKANKIIPNVNTACVCEIILSIYSKLGNCNDAISLWKEMKAQHVIPTSNFKTGLINLLKAHKFSVPEDIYEDETLGENSRKNHN
ncbi:hypothetical protein KM043_010281 [Ampulex compressa]|nr:hypothetical protein KM043_010281 [Ampulex compressa]